MPAVHVPKESFRVLLGMEICWGGQDAQLSSPARALANDHHFKDCFCTVMDRWFTEIKSLSQPLLNGAIEDPFDSTGHVSHDKLAELLTGLLNRHRIDDQRLYAISKLDSLYCIRWNGGWLVIGGYTPLLNGARWTLAEVVDHYVAAKSNTDPSFEEKNKAALSELRRAEMQVCVQYEHHADPAEVEHAHSGGASG
jgi:hypothetical protein